MKKGDFKLYSAGREFLQVEAIGTYLLKLPSSKILELEDSYFIPKIIRNIISISLLLKQDFEINGKDNGCSISFSNEHYCNGILENGLLALSLNDNIFHINESKKWKRKEVNNIFLWHCHLGHISESRMNKLHKEEFFDPYDYESLGIYESYFIEKITKTPFSGYGEDKWVIRTCAYIYIYSPMITQVRGGYTYFVTFTDDLSRLGYVYLMKYKSKIFDKFQKYQSMIKK